MPKVNPTQAFVQIGRTKFMQTFTCKPKGFGSTQPIQSPYQRIDCAVIPRHGFGRWPVEIESMTADLTRTDLTILVNMSYGFMEY